MSRSFWQGFREGMNPMWSLAWILYGIGHAISVLANHWHWFGGRSYRAYNWLMLKSMAICDSFRLSSPWAWEPVAAHEPDAQAPQLLDSDPVTADWPRPPAFKWEPKPRRSRDALTDIMKRMGL